MKVYLDNAATTPLDEEVLEFMMPVMKEHFGNPSSIHSYGRKTRAIVETSRKTIARLLNVSPAEIFFTSGGTEADNMAIHGAVYDLGITHVITSPLEHHAVLHTLEHMQQVGKIKLSILRLKEKGHIDLDHLEELLQQSGPSLVSLMHANNEVANLLPIKKVSELCEQYKALFHADTVQSIGHYQLDLQKIKAHFIVGAAHKFHGPKGTGFIYINHDVQIQPFIFGGAQERNMRGGTENIYAIAGMAKALEIAHRDMAQHQQHIQELKTYMIDQLKQQISGVEFNGDSGSEASLYTVLNVLFPPISSSEMLLFNLDIQGIAVSGGSACSSGSNIGSHVLNALKVDANRPSVRFSFSKYNTKEEIDFCLLKLGEIFAVKEDVK
jgi:cysteine desulfurase